MTILKQQTTDMSLDILDYKLDFLTLKSIKSFFNFDVCLHRSTYISVYKVYLRANEEKK